MLDFIGIGAKKAGTTWLYEMLKQHPEISFPAGKEIHFWDDFKSHGLDWYKNIFAGNECKKGEISPAYACLPQTVIMEIQREFPYLRLIFLIRNPIERAWSAAKMMLARVEITAEEASDQWFIDLFRSRGSLSRGDYEACLRSWLAVFPREQLLIARYEKIEQAPAKLLDDCCKFIGIEQPYDFSQHKLNERIFPSERIEIRPSLEKALKEIYADTIRALSEYLQEDLSSWIE